MPLLVPGDDGDVVAQDGRHAPRTSHPQDCFNRDASFQETLQRMAAGEDRMRRFALSLHEDTRQRIAAGDLESRHFMRILHEDVLSRIATIGEHLQPSPPPARPRKKR
jgi:hypothetical protein